MNRKPSLFQNGAFVGALLGGLLRWLLAIFNLGGGDGSWFKATGDSGWYLVLGLLCIPSAVLGAMCGALAGASRTPLRGLLWGGLLSGITFAALVAPIAMIVALFGAAGKVEQFSLPFLIQRVVLGALVGLVAAEMGRRGRVAINAVSVAPSIPTGTNPGS